MEIKYNPNNSPRNGSLEFWENDNIIMEMGGVGADLVCFFYTRDVIRVSPGMELYEPLKEFMAQGYEFYEDDDLKCSKTPDKLVWYSDLGHIDSVEEVSYLTIERKDDSFELQSRNKLYEKYGATGRPQAIAFRPARNGTYSENIETHFTLQDDFSMIIYNPLYEKYSKQRENNPTHRKTYPN